MIPTPRPGPRFGDCPDCGASTCDCEPIIVLAISTDGWACCFRRRQLFLVRPPFGAEHRYPHTWDEMERALRHEDFRACVLEFPNWPAVDDHLRSVVEENAGAAPVSPSLRILARATDEQIGRHMAAIERRPASPSIVPVLDALALSPHASEATRRRIEMHRAACADRFALRVALHVAEKDAVEQVERDRRAYAGGPRVVG